MIVVILWHGLLFLSWLVPLSLSPYFVDVAGLLFVVIITIVVVVVVVVVVIVVIINIAIVVIGIVAWIVSSAAAACLSCYDFYDRYGSLLVTMPDPSCWRANLTEAGIGMQAMQEKLVRMLGNIQAMTLLAMRLARLHEQVRSPAAS
jgi:hypothetical protein